MEYKNKEDIVTYLEQHGMIDDQIKDACIDALRKVEKYEALERKLESTYGKCDTLLETIVNSLVRFEQAPKDTPDKSVLLTDEDVDRWYEFKAERERE